MPFDDLPLATARRYADKIAEWLTPFCERVEVVGSVRRDRPMCHDIDMVAIPKTVATTRDLFGNVASAEVRNLLGEELRRYVREANDPRVRWIMGEKGQTNFLLHLKACELNVFCADAQTFYPTRITYTGSKEHNICLIGRAKARGLEWRPREGLYQNGKRLWPGPIQAALSSITLSQEDEETALYAYLGLPWITPAEREIDLIAQKFHA